MKKIIFLSIFLLFSSVQAQELSAIEIDQVAAALIKNPKIVTKVRALNEQGLTTNQIAEQLLSRDVKSAHFIELNAKTIAELVVIAVVLCILFYNDRQAKKTTENDSVQEKAKQYDDMMKEAGLLKTE
ncbi:hypothetical protein IPF37_02825 [bacterium]|nr:MAG: hypothetical protein IPF37_02825 [bacterium]